MSWLLRAVFWRWVLALLWTVLIGYLLLWPSEETAVEDVSDTFGGTDLTDAVGHVALMAIETLLVYGVLVHSWPARRALRGAALFTLILGLVLEGAQHWIPSRGFALLDLSANWLGVALCVYGLRAPRGQR